IKGPTAAAYLHRLTTAIQICRDILNLADPRPDAHLTHEASTTKTTKTTKTSSTRTRRTPWTTTTAPRPAANPQPQLEPQ
ncbi:hypothetical protein, partial [Nocardiopsis coralliicola]